MTRCRYCYQTGHNQRTCPTKTERMKNRAEAMIAEGHPDHWMVKEYQDRIAPKGKKASQQTCGYCEERGHTRRKCDLLQKDKEWFAKHHNDHVRLAHDYIVTSPIGIGSLFKYKTRRYDYDSGEYLWFTNMYVLTGFYCHKHVVRGNMTIYATLTNPTSGEEYSISLRDYVINPKYGEDYSSSMVLLSPEAQVIPSDWVFNQSVTVESLGTHPHFTRSGRKNDDTRDWAYRERDRALLLVEKYKEEPDDRYNHLARAKEMLKTYTVEHNRAKIFEDFKSGQ